MENRSTDDHVNAISNEDEKQSGTIISVEESTNNNKEDEIIKNENKSKSKSDGFKERNLIKKVKTNCFNLIVEKIKECLVNPKKFSFYNIKNKEKRKIYRKFKADISKVRNNALLELTVREIIENFSDKNLKTFKIIPEKETKYNFLMNLTWRDLLIYCKNKSYEVFGEQTIFPKLIPSDYSTYINYVQKINYTYDNTTNICNKYLGKFLWNENNKESLLQQTDCVHSFLMTFDGINR